MARRGLWLGSLLFAGGFVACVTNHDALEKKPPAHGGSHAGGSAHAGAPSQLGGFGGQAANGGGHADDEAPGESVLTIVNGVVDAPRVALCLAKVDADGNVSALGSPLTDAPLEYGQSLVLREIEDLDFATDGLQPFVIAGELDLIAGLDCQTAIDRARLVEAQSEGAGNDLGAGGTAGDGSGGPSNAAGSGGSAGESGAGGSETGGSAGSSSEPAVRSPLRVRGLPAISAGTLNAGYSLVFVANGCLGGATYSGKDAEQYCGAGYTPRQPTASAILVRLSRQGGDSEQVALQVVHASLANEQVEVRARPQLPPTDYGVAITSVRMGQVAPRPPSTQNSLVQLGVTRKYVLAVEAQGNRLFTQSWVSVLSQGGLSELSGGHGYALVFNGPRGDLQSVPKLWNAATLTAIAVDPE
ncbi:MAG TPA: hypothetical protein VJV79_16605 [Polyangiaceae bacterium]|nr:hypothetical protein [Polyangiaceae bacterium]